MGRYLDLLVDLMLVRRHLATSIENAGKRVVKSPKVFVRDSGLVHALLGLGSISVLGHPVVGGSWEGVRHRNPDRRRAGGTEHFFYRTAAGAELDLVLRLPGNATWAIEIKRTTTPKVSRGFHLSVDDIKADRKILVYAGEREVPAGDGLRAMPLATAVEQLRNL